MSPTAEEVYVPPKNMGVESVGNVLSFTLLYIHSNSIMNLTPLSRFGTPNTNTVFNQGPETSKVWLCPKSESLVFYHEEDLH